MNKRVLCISDQHFPYQHPDTISFLTAINKKYKPDRVINIGDEFDFHASSFHTSDPDLMSPGDEYAAARKQIAPLFKIFPKMDLMESNHGSMAFRKAQAAGLPSRVIKSYRDILGAPRGWHWHPYLVIKLSNGQSCYFCHHRGDSFKASQAMGMSFVSGHEHSRFEVRYWGNSLGLYFAMTIGCLINDHALAFNYNKLTLKRPVIGLAIIIDGLPRLLPMVLDKRGRWIKVVP